MKNTILKYFPALTEEQAQQFLQLQPLYEDWNSKINVISRKDIGNLYEHHVLHSLAIAKYITFKPGSKVLDIGTGGGFPGIPLAILLPDVQFTLIDSIRKKTLVATEVAAALGLKNVRVLWQRAEEQKELYDFVVSRAVMPMPDLVKLVRKNVSKKCQNALPNGLVVLKGGELQAELRPFGKSVEITNLTTYFDEEFFRTKKLIYLPTV